MGRAARNPARPGRARAERTKCQVIDRPSMRKSSMTPGTAAPMVADVQQIDRHWLAQKIAGRRGLQTRLAEHVGISQDKVAKILAGRREIQGREILPMIEFFEKLDREEGRAPQEPAPEAAGPSASGAPRRINSISISVTDGVAVIGARVDAEGVERLRARLDALAELLRD